MQNRVPTNAGRVLITPESGEPYYAVVTMADNPIVEGSDYNKENVLPDDLCTILGIDSTTAEPKDAFLATIDVIRKSKPSMFQRIMNGRIL